MRLIGSFDSIVLAAVAVDLEALIGARLQRVGQRGEHDIILQLRREGRAGAILCSIHPRWARIHLVSAPPSPGEHGPFALLLRSRLEHARLTTVRQIPFERIAALGFDTDAGAVELVAELMGRHSNLILVQDGVIAGALRPVTAQQSAVHPVTAGLPYRRPPADRPSPAEIGAEQLAALLAASQAALAERLNTALLGISPTMAREVAARAGVDPSSPSAALAAEAARIHRTLTEIADIVDRRVFQPVVYLDGAEACGYAPFALAHISGVPMERAPSMSEAVARVATHLSESEDVEALRAALAASIRAAAARLERSGDEVRRALAEAASGDAVRERGELLLAYASQIAPRSSEATVPGYDGRPVTIPLDPTLTPVENARRLFARYTKIRKARPALEERLQQLAAEQAYLDSALAMAEQASEAADLQALRHELAEDGYVRRGRRRAAAAAPRPRTYTLPGGASVLVGRTNQENDRLTFKIAGPEDLWLHARGVPGAHVILKSGGQSVGPDEIARAAAIAAWFSRARASGAVAVDFTRRKHVRKPRGARPGFVVYEREETVRVAPALPPAG